MEFGNFHYSLYMHFIHNLIKSSIFIKKYRVSASNNSFSFGNINQNDSVLEQVNLVNQQDLEDKERLEKEINELKSSITLKKELLVNLTTEVKQYKQDLKNIKIDINQEQKEIIKKYFILQFKKNEKKEEIKTLTQDIVNLKNKLEKAIKKQLQEFQKEEQSEHSFFTNKKDILKVLCEEQNSPRKQNILNKELLESENEERLQIKFINKIFEYKGTDIVINEIKKELLNLKEINNNSKNESLEIILKIEKIIKVFNEDFLKEDLNCIFSFLKENLKEDLNSMFLFLKENLFAFYYEFLYIIKFELKDKHREIIDFVKIKNSKGIINSVKVEKPKNLEDYESYIDKEIYEKYFIKNNNHNCFINHHPFFVSNIVLKNFHFMYFSTLYEEQNKLKVFVLNENILEGIPDGNLNEFIQCVFYR